MESQAQLGSGHDARRSCPVDERNRFRRPVLFNVSAETHSFVLLIDLKWICCGSLGDQT